ncbi:MAG: galactokinase [Planctomycetes bacterium]|nr:galactokinase [Planctomycetota bacterium]
MPALHRQQNELLDSLRACWRAEFGGPAQVFFAPGRVNLLGAHLDYNQGFVLPAAVDRGTFVFARPRDDRRIRLRSLDREPVLDLDLDALSYDPAHAWANYAKGALAAFGPAQPGMDLLFGGNLPIGAGLSSSASILVATATAANHYTTNKRSTREIVYLCRDAEVNFVGVRCGIMDHYASAFGRDDHLLYLDCRTDTHADVPFDSGRAAVVVCDTTRRRELADGRFNDRVRECAEAVAALRRAGLQIDALRDLSMDELLKYKNTLDPLLARRAIHVVSEIERTRSGVESLRRGDLAAFGEQLIQSHASCRDYYEVSSPELDALVEAACSVHGALGARLTGAGFGGCCVAVVDRNEIDRFIKETASIYHKRTGLHARIYPFKPAMGAGRRADLE